MRISSAQFYQQSLLTMFKQTEELQNTQLQLTAGLRILKPSDDPSGSVKVLNLNTNIGTVEQFDRNAGTAQADLSQQDSVLTNMNDALQRIRELTIQGLNPTNHDAARVNIALEIDQRLKEIVSMANTRDSNGEYLFAGAQGQQVPFTDNAGSVVYNGDQTERSVVIGDGASLISRDSGDKLFMKIPAGNGVVQAQAGASNKGTVLVGQFSADTTFVPGTYTVTFNGGSYSVSDGTSTIATGVYNDGDSLNFAGVSMALTGTPANGDTLVVKPSQNQSIFELVKGIASALRIPSGNGGNIAKIQNQLSEGLSGLDQTMNTVNNQQATVGARLNTIDHIGSINADYKLQLNTLKSKTQDLDFAEALTRVNQQLTSLQAAQQTYAKTSQLSLFKYL